MEMVFLSRNVRKSRLKALIFNFIFNFYFLILFFRDIKSCFVVANEVLKAYILKVILGVNKLKNSFLQSKNSNLDSQVTRGNKTML